MIFGYIDPGTGSLFLQTVIGGLLGVMFVFRKFIARLVVNTKRIFKRNTKSRHGKTPNSEVEEK